MPNKICQNCKAENHVRRLSCVSCGTAFQHKSKEKKDKKDKKEIKNPSTIEMGTWIKDIPKGMPTVEESPPIKVMLNNDEIRSSIEYEGFGYCVSEYVDPKYIKDDELKRLWIDAKNKLKDVKRYLYK